MRLRPAAASLVLAATLLLGGGEVWAAPPLDLPGELVDDGGALADPEAVRVGQEALHHETGRQLFVAVVDDLDGLTPAQWLAETARLSGLGETDLALVVAAPPGAGSASATLPLATGLLVPPGAGLPPGAAARVEREAQEAAREGDADAVVLAALDGLREAGVDGPGEAAARVAWWVAGGLLLLAVAVTAALWLVRRARRRRQEAADAERAEELSTTLGAAVVALDRELDEADLEVDLLEAEVRDEEGARRLADGRATLQSVRSQAVEVHRRRSELSLGPSDALTWRVPPGEAVAELARISTRP